MHIYKLNQFYSVFLSINCVIFVRFYMLKLRDLQKFLIAVFSVKYKKNDLCRGFNLFLFYYRVNAFFEYILEDCYI